MFFRSFKQLRRIGFLTQAKRSATKVTPLKPFVQNVQKDYAGKMLHVHWENNTLNRFPYIFLRDNCQCPECFHESTQMRSFDSVLLADIKAEVEEVKLSRGGQLVSIVWPDKHVSVFEAGWLRKRCLPDNRTSPRDNASIARKGVVLWDGEKLQDKIPGFEFQELMEDDFTLMHWLRALHSYGITLVKNVPIESGPSRKLTDRVGYLKPTYFGDVWHVCSKFQAHNLAYTTHELPLHTDLPQCDEYPGIQLLHCIEQAPSTGGSNMFVDGFHVSQKLKEAEPDFFQLLATVPILYSDAATYMYGECHMQFSRPVIKLDQTGTIVEFSFNNHTRESFLNLSPEETCKLYEAYLTIGRMLRDPVNRIDHKLRPGEMMVFNNSRVLHGRTKFTITREGTRLLEGNYIDWDIAYSRLRVLAKKFNMPIDV